MTTITNADRCPTCRAAMVMRLVPVAGRAAPFQDWVCLMCERRARRGPDGWGVVADYVPDSLASIAEQLRDNAAAFGAMRSALEGA